MIVSSSSGSLPLLALGFGSRLLRLFLLCEEMSCSKRLCNGRRRAGGRGDEGGGVRDSARVRGSFVGKVACLLGVFCGSAEVSGDLLSGESRSLISGSSLSTLCLFFLEVAVFTPPWEGVAAFLGVLGDSAVYVFCFRLGGMRVPSRYFPWECHLRERRSVGGSVGGAPAYEGPISAVFLSNGDFSLGNFSLGLGEPHFVAVCSSLALGEEGECPLAGVRASFIVKPGVYDSIGTVIDAARVSANEELSISLGEMLGVPESSPVKVKMPGKPPSFDISCSLSANNS